MNRDFASNKLGIRNWLTFIIAGLVGQFAWTIENMYLNRYLFALTGSTELIDVMVAASAIAATLTTLLMGALCDRIGKRKPFIFLGYIIWGISIISFGFLQVENSNTLMFIGPMIVLLDCVMTFFGSSANDAAFNAYVTDVTDDTNRGKVESVIAILPLVAMLIIFGLFEGMIAEGKWNIFYYIFGGLVLLVGVGLIFLMPKDKNKPNTKENYFKNIFYGFRPSTIKQNPMLYIVLIAFAIFSMGIQTFYPYFIIYIQEGLQIKEMNFVLVMGGVLLTACIVTVVFGLFMDKIGTNKVLIPSIVITGVGALLMFFAKHVAFMVPAGILMMSGLMISQAAFGAKIRQYTPEEETGLFQGIRMMFSVLLPMVTGPFIGEWLYELTSDGTYTNEFNEIVTIPNEYIFLGAAIIIVVSIVPVILILRKELKNGK